MPTTLDYADLDGGFYLGTCPKTPEDAATLAETLAIDSVVNLQNDDDFRALGIHWKSMWRALVGRGMEVLHVPMVDGDPADIERHFAAAVEATAAALDDGCRVYLHCTHGRTRSPTGAIATLAGPRGMGLEAAKAHVRARRRIIPLPDIIVRYLTERHPDAL